MSHCTDVSALCDVDDKALLEFIRQRYVSEHNGWETWCGSDVLVIVNPYTKSSEKNDQDIWSQLRRCGMNYIGAPPHPFTMAAKALQRMMRQNAPVYSIISGESGTGKTHSARLMMEYVVQCCSSGSSGSKEMPENRVVNPWLRSVLCTNPMLEAFGNAATTRNNNSSRFGKITKMHLDFPERHYFRVAAAQLRRVEVSTVLLGTTRLTNLPANDRSFHILHGTKKAFQELWHEIGPEFPFLNDVRELCLDLAGTCLGNAPEPDVRNDRGTHTPEDWFRYVATHLKEINVSEERIEDIFRAIMGCCYLLDVEFEEDQNAGEGQTMITSKTRLYFQRAAELLRMDILSLEDELLIKRKKSAFGDDIVSHNKPAQAKSYASSLARSVYNLVFNTVVSCINGHLAHLAPKSNDNTSGNWYSQSVGIVDIYGFEQFQKNGFEQLLINYFNEHQHQLFMHEMISAEKLEYAAEQVTVPPDVLVQLEQNPDAIADNRIAGLNATFQMLSHTTKDAVTARAKLKADGLQFLDKLEKIVKDGATKVSVRRELVDVAGETIREFIDPKPVKGKVGIKPGEETFMVTHYANDVEYVLEEFVESNKNDDVVATSMRALSNIDFINDGLDKNNAVSTNKLSDPNSFVANRFLNEIDNYRELLEGAGQLFVRCVGPNPKKGSVNVDLAHVQRQLNCMGLFHATTIRSRGYPTRICYTELYDRIVGLMSDEFKEMMLSLGDGRGDRIRNAQIFVKLLVEAMVLPDFRQCFVRTVEQAFGQNVVWHESNCDVKLGEDVVFGKQKLFCRPGKATAFEYIKILSEQFPDQTKELAETINKHVSVERVRKIREENFNKLVGLLTKKLEEFNEYHNYLKADTVYTLRLNKVAVRAVENRGRELCDLVYDDWYVAAQNCKRERENEERETKQMAIAEAEERARMFKEAELLREARELQTMTLQESHTRHYLSTIEQKRSTIQTTEWNRIEAERIERERLARLEAERLEKLRLQKLEEERIERERLEAERKKKEEEERLAREEEERRLEAERLKKEEEERLQREEEERIKREEEEKMRIQKEKEEEEERVRLQKEAEEEAERVRLQKEKEEEEERIRLEKEAEEAARIQKEKEEAEEQERIQKEKEEAERIEKERKEQEEKDRIEKERKEQEEKEEEEKRLAAEKEERARQERSAEKKRAAAEALRQLQENQKRLSEEAQKENNVPPSPAKVLRTDSNISESKRLSITDPSPRRISVLSDVMNIRHSITGSGDRPDSMPRHKRKTNSGVPVPMATNSISPERKDHADIVRQKEELRRAASAERAIIQEKYQALLQKNRVLEKKTSNLETEKEELAQKLQKSERKRASIEVDTKFPDTWMPPPEPTRLQASPIANLASTHESMTKSPLAVLNESSLADFVPHGRESELSSIFQLSPSRNMDMTVDNSLLLDSPHNITQSPRRQIDFSPPDEPTLLPQASPEQPHTTIPPPITPNETAIPPPPVTPAEEVAPAPVKAVPSFLAPTFSSMAKSVTNMVRSSMIPAAKPISKLLRAATGRPPVSIPTNKNRTTHAVPKKKPGVKIKGLTNRNRLKSPALHTGKATTSYDKVIVAPGQKPTKGAKSINNPSFHEASASSKLAKPGFSRLPKAKPRGRKKEGLDSSMNSQSRNDESFATLDTCPEEDMTSVHSTDIFGLKKNDSDGFAVPQQPPERFPSESPPLNHPPLSPEQSSTLTKFLRAVTPASVKKKITQMFGD